jgi:rhodanese-related sulfurtransferase
VAVKAGAEEGSIDLETFRKIIEENPQSIYLVDVRDPDEFAAGHFQTAVNIPVAELEEKVDNLPADKPIVFVCSTGARSGESYYMLQDIKPELKKVYYLEAEIEYNKDGSYKIKKTP